MKELIEQIGGRERLLQIIELCGDHNPEVATLARIALAVLDAKPVIYEAEINGVMSSVTKRHYDDCKRFGVPVRELYTTPAAASATDGLAAAVNRLLDTDGSRGRFSAIRRGDALAEVERLLASAPAPGGDGG